jgi:DNA-binding LacI/PurR family transcriptional regulator
LGSLGLPLVWLNRDIDHDAVYPDETAAARDAVNRAIALGHRRIAWLEWHAKTRNRFPHFSIAARRGGCAAACRTAGIALRRIQLPEGACRTDVAPAAHHLRAILDETVPPTLLLGQADEPSLAWTALAGSQVRRIPGDCSLLYLGIGHITVVPLAPTGTMVDWPAIGAAAAAMLIARLAGAPSQTSIAVPCIWSPGVTLTTAPNVDG